MIIWTPFSDTSRPKPNPRNPHNSVRCLILFSEAYRKLAEQRVSIGRFWYNDPNLKSNGYWESEIFGEVIGFVPIENLIGTQQWIGDNTEPGLRKRYRDEVARELCMACKENIPLMWCVVGEGEFGVATVEHKTGPNSPPMRCLANIIHEDNGGYALHPNDPKVGLGFVEPKKKDIA